MKYSAFRLLPAKDQQKVRTAARRSLMLRAQEAARDELKAPLLPELTSRAWLEASIDGECERIARDPEWLHQVLSGGPAERPKRK